MPPSSSIFARFSSKLSGHLVEEQHLVEGAGDAALGRGAVVGDDHDQRVVELADLLERVEDAAEVVVGVRDEAGVDLHHPGVEAPLVVGQRVPLGHVGIARRELGVRRQQAELLLAREHRLAVGVPARVELALVAVGPLLRHVVRSVRRAGRVVHEERLLGRVDVRVEDQLDRVVGQVLAEVVALLRRPRLRDRRVVLGQVGIPLVRLAAEEAVEALEPAAERPAVERARRGVVLRRRQVPLAEAERVVAVLEQHLGQHPVLERHAPVVAGVAGRQLHDARDAVGVVVAAGQDARPRRRAQRRGVHVRVAQALRGDAIDVGRLDEPAEARQLAVSDIVEHEEEHVRGAVPRPRRRRPGGAGLAPPSARSCRGTRCRADTPRCRSSLSSANGTRRTGPRLAGRARITRTG